MEKKGVTVSSIGTKISENKLIITLEEFKESHKTTIKEMFNLKPSQVMFKQGDMPIQARTSERDPLEAGLSIVNDSAGGACTSNISAQNSSGEYFLISAGHCGIVGDTYTQGGRTIGDVRQVVSMGGRSDAMAIEISSSLASDFLYTTSSQAIQIANRQSESSSFEGEELCKSGNTTGVTCGTVSNVNYTANYNGESYTEQRLVEHDVTTSCMVDSGDSGGPVYDGSTIVGIVSGGTNLSGGCDNESTDLIFTHIDNALGDLVLSGTFE